MIKFLKELKRRYSLIVENDVNFNNKLKEVASDIEEIRNSKDKMERELYDEIDFYNENLLKKINDKSGIFLKLIKANKKEIKALCGSLEEKKVIIEYKKEKKEVNCVAFFDVGNDVLFLYKDGSKEVLRGEIILRPK